MACGFSLSGLAYTRYPLLSLFLLLWVGGHGRRRRRLLMAPATAVATARIGARP